MAKIRLDKYIANGGVYTRSRAKKLIHANKVSVGGKTVTDEAFKVDEEQTDIAVNGINVRAEKYIYIMLNKPSGVISATHDKKQKTVIDLIAPQDRRNGLFPAGRLDIDTEGLIILTNDGDFAHNTLSPKKHVSKLYAADVENYTFSAESQKRFGDGIVLLDGSKCKPAILTYKGRGEGYVSVTLEITEGKFHQVKKMFESEGGRVIRLKRLSFGEIQLDDALKSGEYRKLNPTEMLYVEKIKNNNGA